MKRFALLLAALLALSFLFALPALAEVVDALPVPENCQPIENYIGQNSVSYLDYADMADPFRGWVGENTAMFMEDTPEGRIFVGYVRQEDGRWLRTESTPLPEGAVCQYIITEEDSFYFSYPHPQGLKNEDGSTKWMTVLIRLESDGVWRFFGGQLSAYEVFFGYDNDILLVNLLGYAYGTYTLDRDVRTIDWSAIPMTWDAAAACLAPDMGVIGAQPLPLYADAAGTTLLAEYHIGTPVTVLEQEADMARVRIWDSDVIGWVQADGLLLGSDQVLVTGTYEDEDGVQQWLGLATTTVPACLTGSAANLYDAPDGTIIRVAEGETMLLLADLGNGWYHVGVNPFDRPSLPEGTPMTCYIHAEQIAEMSGDAAE
ncbi:MAG: hypothetical protein IKK57_11130 [Clostridia bacterium]|nr:hypothetical protein [Clostridia bacterium]